MPKVWNKRDPNCPKDAVYVGRPSKWGNPWRIGEMSPVDGHRFTREEVIELHKQALPQMLKVKDIEGVIILDISELRGKDLVCWCAPSPCHADILLELANKESK